MKTVKLTRIEKSAECTIGALQVNGKSVCWTLEEPWRYNEPDVSCIPEGTYDLELEYSPSKGKKLWTIKGVPDRSYVRIHTGNTVDDTEGCPLTGSTLGELHGKRAVLGSRAAFGKFMAAMSQGTRARIKVVGG